MIKRILTLAIVAGAILSAGFGIHQANSATFGAVRLTQLSSVPAGLNTRLCASGSRVIKLGQLAWKTTSNYSSLSSVAGHPNCRLYTAPAASYFVLRGTNDGNCRPWSCLLNANGGYAWDQVTVSYRGAKAWTRFYIVNPMRP